MQKSNYFNRINIEERSIEGLSGGSAYIMTERECDLGYITEKQRKTPVLFDCDVVVLGGGISGCISAICAGRAGKETVLVERFATVGGNVGPGMIIGGAIEGSKRGVLPTGPVSIPKEFVDTLYSNCYRTRCYPENASVASWVLLNMLEEAGVSVITSAYGADPIMDGNVAKGITVEGKSGRSAILAKVVIDATGDASLAERAGAPMIQYVPPVPENEIFIKPTRNGKEFLKWNECAISFIVAGVDTEAFDKMDCGAEEANQDDGNVKEAFSFGEKSIVAPGIVQLNAKLYGSIDTNSTLQIAAAEGFLQNKMRSLLKECKKKYDFFKNAYIIATAPFMGARGGPCIEGEHVLTLDEAYAGTPFKDTLYKNIFRRGHAKTGYNKDGFDVPYGIVLPKEIDGMIVCGRGASYIRRGHDGPGMRQRLSLMTLAEACGYAASIAATEGVSPKKVDVAKIQNKMRKAGYVL